MKPKGSLILKTIALLLTTFIQVILSEEETKTTLALDDLVIMLNNKDTDRLNAKAPPQVCGDMYQSKKTSVSRCNLLQWKSVSRNWQITEMRNSPTYMKIMAFMLKN
jgi:hypothetical protein